MASNKKITELTELTEIDLSDDDVLPIVDVSAGTTNKVRKSTLASALAGVASMSATSPVAVNQATGAVTVSLDTVPITSGGTGAVTADDARNNLGAALDPTDTRGDLITRGITTLDKLAIGSNNYVLKSNGTDPVWGQVDGGEVTGTVAVVNGGTGSTTSSGALTNLGAAASGANTDITSLGGLTTDIAVADGGTGASTASAARTNLGAAASGANTDITSLGGLTTDIAVADGGTGASDAATARSNLGAAASGANSDITSLTGLTTDLSVSQGGTGAGTFTANGVLYGNGTSAIGATGTGTSGQVLTSNGSGSAPTFQAVAAGGKVLQVVQASTSTQAESTSSTYADTNLSATITPSSTSSKVLVLAAQQITSAGGRAVAAVNIVRGATQVIEFNQISNPDNQSGTHYLPYLDSPSTTSATTYKTQIKRIDQSGTVQAQRNDVSGNATSVITLMEIGA